MTDFQVRRTSLRDARFVTLDRPPLAFGAVRLRIDLFALTANNVIYSAMGGGLNYWDFFPAPKDWGRPPVWGFATVETSRLPDIEPGERVYGLFPVSETLDVLPSRRSAAGFADGIREQRSKATLYNRYLFTDQDPAYDEEFEAEQALFRPLFSTGWWIADTICHSILTPSTVVMSSASSKAALTTAFQLQRLEDTQLIGLTSDDHLDYVKEIGLYHDVFAYDDLEALMTEGPTVFVDFLGRDHVTSTVHHALSDRLTRSLAIGVLNWKAASAGAAVVGLPGPVREFFSVPDYAARRIGQAGNCLNEAMTEDLGRFYEEAANFISPTHLSGSQAIAQAWARLVDDDVPPDEGLVLSFR